MTKIGKDAFYYSGIESVVIPSTVQTIGASTFAHCDSLTKVTIGEGAEQIEYTMISNSAFEYCPKLATVIITDNVKTISSSAFRNCPELTSVTFGKNLESIGSKAFYSCGSLTSITLTSDLMSIGSDAFRYCEKLATVNYEGTVAQWSLVEKSSSWANNTALTAIKCTDGEAATK